MNAPVVADLAVKINREHEYAFGKAREALEHARHAGELLLQAKAAVAHGAWLPWIAENVKFSETTAQGYMRLAKRWGTLPVKSATVADLSLRDALKHLAAPADPHRQHGVGADQDIDAGGEVHGGEHPVEHGAGDGDAQRPDAHGAGRPLTARVGIDGIKIPNAIDKREDVQIQVFAALLDAWDGASRKTKESFLIQNAAEIRDISKRWRRRLKIAEGR